MQRPDCYRLQAVVLAAVFVLLPAPAVSAEKNGADVPSDDIFGFTSPTDVGNKGDFAFANEFDGRLKHRDGIYKAFTTKSEFGYTVSDNFWVGMSGFTSSHRVFNITETDDATDIENRRRRDFDGLSTEFQYRILQRSGSNPFAITVAVEPRWGRIDYGSGLRSENYSAEFKLFMDVPIVADKLFWAANATWTAQRAQETENRSIWLDSGESVLSTALTFQISPNFFMGVEARHLAFYDTASLHDRIGYAIYVGPTFFWKFTDKLAFNATWQPQVKGKSIDNLDLRYDLDNFERSQFRFKLSLSLN